MMMQAAGPLNRNLVGAGAAPRRQGRSACSCVGRTGDACPAIPAGPARPTRNGMSRWCGGTDPRSASRWAGAIS